MPFDHIDSIMRIHLVVDGSSIECFAEDGKLAMTSTFSLSDPFDTIMLFTVNGDIEMPEGKVIELNSIR